MPNNPYIAGNPVGKTDTFIGRKDVLREVLRIIENPNQNALALFGQRRIGKTSILQYITLELSAGGKYRAVYFDLQDKGALTLGNVVESLAKTIAFSLGLSEPVLGNKPESAFRENWLPESLNKLAGNEKLVLLFDEFDVLADPTGDQAAKAFFPYLRSLLEQELDRLKFVFVLGRRIDDLDSIALSVFKGIPPYRVSLLDQKDTEELIRLSERNSTLRWQNDAIAYVWKLTHGHPYLTQQLCSQVWDSLYDDNTNEIPVVTEENIENVIQKTLDSSRNALEWIWNGLPPAERVVISALAEAGPGQINDEQLEKILHDSGIRVVIRELRDAPALLQEWDLIEPAQNKNSYIFRVELLRRWLILAKPLRRVQEELDRLTPVADNLYKAAQGIYESGNLDGASDLLHQAVARNPNHLRANELLGEILITQNQWDEALKIYEHLFEFNPAVARSRLVQVLLELANKSETDSEKVKYYTRVLEIEPQKQANLQSVRDKLRSEILARELLALERMQKEKHYKDARVKAEELAMEYPEGHDWKALLTDLDGHLDLKGIHERAMAAFEGGDIITARRLFADVVAIEPEFEDAVHYLNVIVSGIDVQPKKSRPHYVLGNIVLSIVSLISLVGMVWISYRYSLIETQTEALAAQATAFAAVSMTPLWTATAPPTVPASPIPSATPKTVFAPGDEIAVFGKGTLNAMALSPNGDMLGLGTSLGVYLYKVDTLSEAMFVPSESPVDALSFSPGGDLMAIGARDNLVKIFNVTDGRLVHIFAGHSDWIRCISFSPDGLTLASGGEDNTVRIWSLKDGSLIRVLRGHSNYIYALSYSPNGLYLASGSNDNTVKIWSSIDGALLYTMKGHTNTVRSIVFSPDGSQLASGSYDNTVKIWSSDGRLLRTLTGHTGDVNSVDFSPNGQLLASGSDDNTVRIWNLSDGSTVDTLTGNVDQVNIIAYSLDGEKLITASREGSVRIWSLRDKNMVNELTMFYGSVYSVALSPDGKTMAAGPGDQRVRIWDINSRNLVRVLEGHINTIYSMAYSPDGQNLATGEWGAVWIWNVDDGNRLQVLEDTNWVWGIAYSPDGKLLATGSGNDTAKIWNATDGELIFTLSGHTNDVRCVAFSPDGLYLATGSYDLTVRIWSVVDGALVRTLENNSTVYGIAFSPDGSRIATASANGTVKVWNIDDGSLYQTLSGPSSSIYSVAFSHDGIKLAGGSSDNTIWVWNIADGDMLYVLTGHTNSVYDLEFSANDQTLISGSTDGTIRIWRLK